jgi:hypothetical protein
MNVSAHRKKHFFVHFSATFYLQKKNKHFEHLGNFLTVQQWTEIISVVNVLSVEPYDVRVMPKHFMHVVYVEY